MLVAILALGEGEGNLALTLAIAFASRFRRGADLRRGPPSAGAALSAHRRHRPAGTLHRAHRPDRARCRLAHPCRRLVTRLRRLSAGVLLADSVYRHQIAADIRPFRGLLLGLFFVSVGMQLDLAALIDQPLAVFGVVIALVVVKALVIASLALLSGLGPRNALRTGIMLAQGGEFAFVLWSAAGAMGVLGGDGSRILVVAVALSMALTPFLFMLLDRFLPTASASSAALSIVNEPEAIEEIEDHVVVIGCGIVGTQVLMQLQEKGVPVLALDRDVAKVRQLRRHTEHAFFGDATQPDVLEMIHIERASAVVIALDDPRQDLLVVGILHYLFLDMPILARAHDEAHGELLQKAGATTVIPEVIDTGRHLVDALLLAGAGNHEIMLSER
ncbi:MAG: NAD-binding protein [Geminicoccaceae bacterium]